MKASVFVNYDGELYVKMDTIMSWFVASHDRIKYTLFGRGKTPYLPIDVAISWCEEEAKHTKTGKHKEKAAIMRRVKEQEATILPPREQERLERNFEKFDDAAHYDRLDQETEDGGEDEARRHRRMLDRVKSISRREK